MTSKVFITLLFLISFSVLAESPYDKFSINQNMTNKSKIIWEYADNIQAACNKQRTDGGYKPYTYEVLACSSWRRNIFFQYECHIITKKNVTMWIIGHEIRHCFQGSFHEM